MFMKKKLQECELEVSYIFIRKIFFLLDLLILGKIRIEKISVMVKMAAGK